MTGRPTAFREEFHDIVLDVGKRGGSLVEMAVACGVSRSTFYEFIENDHAFSDTVTRARDMAQAWWESKGREAVEGKIVNFSANAFTFQMRNRFADYRDVQHVEQNFTGLPSPTVTGISFRILDPAKMETEDLEQLADMMQRQSPVIDHEITNPEDISNKEKI